MDYAQLVASNKDTIIETWVARVRADSFIESTDDLTYKGILDSLPMLIDAIAHLLSNTNTTSIHTLQESGIDHGKLRAQQGYSASEIVREYGLLRDIILELIEPELLQSTPQIALRAVRLVNGIIDQVIATCLRRYTDERLREVNLLYDEMLASNQELDRLIRNEQTNTAYMAHELKTPLTCIIGYSDLFLRKQGDSGELRLEFIEQVLTSGRKLLETINHTLEESSYRSGQVPLNLTWINVGEVILEVTTTLETLALQKGLSLKFERPLAAISVLTDRARFRQVLTNLVSNAVRYTESGSICVSLVLGENGAEEGVEIAIADTGLGIDDTELARIFEPYYQGHAGQQLPTSSGLGLAIAQQMVQLLQGKIRVTSEPDAGSTFTITLPRQYQSQDQSQDQSQPSKEASGPLAANLTPAGHDNAYPDLTDLARTHCL
ncbi:MAG: sensor histidine kinase [Cyanobacteria bacterium J06631_9]